MEMERPEVFFTHEWAVAVERAYRDSLAPFVVLGYEGECLVAAVALAEHRTDGGHVEFLAGPTADYCDFLSHPDRRNEFTAGVFAELRKRGVEKIILANLPADSRSVQAISSGASGCNYHL